MNLKTQQTDILGHDNHSRQYWAFQITGWSAMAMLSYLSLTVWYNPGEVAPAVHTIVQSLLGIIVSHPLRWISTSLWNRTLLARAILNGLTVVIASLIWTALRITTFTYLTGEVIPSTDWGGWIFASIMVFGAWSFCYHALKYYRLSLMQRQLTAEAQTTALQAQAIAQQESLRRLEAEKLFKESQLRMLTYQLNPHFFLNALNSVSALVQKGRKSAAMDMLARIGDFLRISLEHEDELNHTIEEELDAIETYLSIEIVRFGDRLRTEFDVDASVRHILIPRLLLQPLFENAIKHAVGQRASQTTLRFEAKPERNGVHMRLSDDGPGIDSTGDELLKTNAGIGLLNVKNRLESTYGEDFEFQLHGDQDTGLTIDIWIGESHVESNPSKVLSV